MKRALLVLLAALPLCCGDFGDLATAQQVQSAPQLTVVQVEQGEKSDLVRSEHELARRTESLARAYAQESDSAKRRELEDRLRESVDNHFAVKQQLRAEELKQLEAQLRKLQTQHERRNEARSQITRDRVQQLLREADGLGWGSQSTSGAWSADYRPFPAARPSVIGPVAPTEPLVVPTPVQPAR